MSSRRTRSAVGEARSSPSSCPAPGRRRPRLVAQRVRETLAALNLHGRGGERLPSPTVSQGIASCPRSRHRRGRAGATWPTGRSTRQRKGPRPGCGGGPLSPLFSSCGFAALQAGAGPCTARPRPVATRSLARCLAGPARPHRSPRVPAPGPAHSSRPSARARGAAIRRPPDVSGSQSSRIRSSGTPSAASARGPFRLSSPPKTYSRFRHMPPGQMPWAAYSSAPGSSGTAPAEMRRRTPAGRGHLRGVAQQPKAGDVGGAGDAGAGGRLGGQAVQPQHALRGRPPRAPARRPPASGRW